MATVRPSIQPSSRSRLTNAAVHSLQVEAHALVVDRGQLMTRRQSHDQVAMEPHRRAPGRDQAPIRSACEGRNRALDLAGAAYVDRADLHSE